MKGKKAISGLSERKYSKFRDISRHSGGMDTKGTMSQHIGDIFTPRKQTSNRLQFKKEEEQRKKNRKRKQTEKNQYNYNTFFKI